MNETLAPLLESVRRLERDASADGGGTVAEVGDRALMRLNAELGVLRRATEAVHARVAAEIQRRSRPELGAAGLTKKNGFRTPAVLIATTTGTSVGEAARLVAVGEATQPRARFGGGSAPPKHPHVAAALAGGTITVAASAAIIAMLDRVAMRTEKEALDRAELRLVEQASGLPIDQLHKIIARAQAHLDPAGVAERESELRAGRELHMFQRSGMLHLRGSFDPEAGAPIKAAVDALVSAEFRSERDGHDIGPTDAATTPPVDLSDSPQRSVPRRQADALALLAWAARAGGQSDMPMGGATVIVRVSLDDLESGEGSATIDGIDEPVSVTTARRMAADGCAIPWVLGAAGEILDWGRERRLFLKPQRLALVERDGGCAMCGAPPGWTKAHHLRWWARDAGPTDLDNGVLLCESCHHRIHDNGWEIQVTGIGVAATVWFIPPPWVDPARRPRLGGRRRFDFVAA